MCAVEVCVIYTFTLLGADMMYVCHMAVAVILCAVLLLIAKILKQEVKRNEKKKKKGIIYSVMVETYALLAFVVSIMLLGRF